MLQSAKRILRSALPISIINRLKALYILINPYAFKIKIIWVHFNYNRVLARVKNKEKVKVVFFLLHDADWKFEGVYRLMQKDVRFDPIVVVCPFISFGQDFMLKVMTQSFDSFQKEGYHVIKALDEKKGEWLDVKKEIKPDLVCFTSPWRLTRPEYLLDNFLDTLTCYVPYGYETSHLHEAYYNSAMQNLVWKFFLENNIHKALSIQYSRNKGRNSVVSGYPGLDKFLVTDQKPRDVWKIKDPKIKRIIWAAHHTIPGRGASLDYSTFLMYSEVMIEMATRFKDFIQISFKPHPILRENLNRDDVWGKERTDEYYKRWEELDNGQLVEGDYLDLFFTSEAIIHDCGSFVIEYLYTRKPVLYLFRDEQIADRFNEVGKMALSKFYHGRTEQDIVEFIQKVVIGNQDSLKEERNHFFESVIKPPNNITASENIFRTIVSEIFD